MVVQTETETHTKCLLRSCLYVGSTALELHLVIEKSQRFRCRRTIKMDMKLDLFWDTRGRKLGLNIDEIVGAGRIFVRKIVSLLFRQDACYRVPKFNYQGRNGIIHHVM